MSPDSAGVRPAAPQPTGRLDAADRARLGPGQLDAVTAALLNLVAEVASLAERVRVLEAGSTGEPVTDAAAVHDLVRRVVAPLAEP
jgi:hypothetical protein